jgi:hypothetical protein
MLEQGITNTPDLRDWTTSIKLLHEPCLAHWQCVATRSARPFPQRVTTSVVLVSTQPALLAGPPMPSGKVADVLACAALAV